MERLRGLLSPGLWTERGASLLAGVLAAAAILAAGVMIILLGHFRAGDLIEAAGQKGRVLDVQIFSTVLLDENGVKVIVPNGAVTAGTIRVHSEAAGERPAASPQARAG
jgi:small-conductance mechanosensitive channel